MVLQWVARTMQLSELLYSTRISKVSSHDWRGTDILVSFLLVATVINYLQKQMLHLNVTWIVNPSNYLVLFFLCSNFVVWFVWFFFLLSFPLGSSSSVVSFCQWSDRKNCMNQDPTKPKLLLQPITFFSTWLLLCLKKSCFIIWKK